MRRRARFSVQRWCPYHDGLFRPEFEKKRIWLEIKLSDEIIVERLTLIRTLISLSRRIPVATDSTMDSGNRWKVLYPIQRWYDKFWTIVSFQRNIYYHHMIAKFYKLHINYKRHCNLKPLNTKSSASNVQNTSNVLIQRGFPSCCLFVLGPSGENRRIRRSPTARARNFY